MTRAERGLLLELFRWARTEGVRRDGAMRWTSPPPHRWGVDFWNGMDDRDLQVWREGQMVAANYRVTSIAEAVDQLVALGIAPAKFSTAYRAGYNAAMRAHQIARSVPDKLSSPRGWSAPEIFALLPAADTELAVGR
ncbi:hypothetical protein ACTOB_001369 [Actinoplanes oblitus]|uniref:Integrase n=1 Tax=Actinoplanes oblitus TaxID=3040509 RepID=A0ABY8WPW9_9ACTN|nr:hypothetical protein [Actinoplanes oblitus]WIM97815.1 hypothetical protein ACTOB_001369 [Actinoplanes oblitus]